MLVLLFSNSSLVFLQLGLDSKALFNRKSKPCFLFIAFNHLSCSFREGLRAQTSISVSLIISTPIPTICSEEHHTQYVQSSRERERATWCECVILVKEQNMLISSHVFFLAIKRSTLCSQLRTCKK